MNLKHARVRRVAIVAFVLASLAFFAVALVDAWHATNGELPSVPRLVLAALLVAVGLLASAYGWAALLGGHRSHHAAGLLVSQIGKYIPGGIWQATGQVGLARSAGVRVSRAVTAFTVLALTQVLAGCVFGVVLAVVWTDGRIAVRIVIGIGSLAVLALLDRRWMIWALHRIPRTRDASADLVPPQRSIFVAWMMSIIALTTTSVAFVLLLGSVETVNHPVTVLASYAVAWTVGFVALPIPSGLGIREAVLVGILHGSFATSVLVAASVYQRLVSIATEGILAAVASRRARQIRALEQPAESRQEQTEAVIEGARQEPPGLPRPDGE